MFVRTSQGGSLIEGREQRKGGSSMKIGTYCRDWDVSDYRETLIQVPELPMPVTQISYRIHFKTFLPLSTLGEVKRYDTLGFWKLSFQECLRHLGLANTYTSSPLWKTMTDIVASEKESLIDIWLQWMDKVLNSDTSLEQFIYYAKEHETSADPFGLGKWKDLLESPGTLKLAHERTLQWMREFRAEFGNLCKGNNLMIKAENCYPGVRARPPDYTVMTSGDFEGIVFAQKWRDRKVGGIKGLSQFGFPIYKNEAKKQADAIMHNYMKKILGIPVNSLSDLGPQIYKQMITDEKCYTYDLKTAEKQVGLLFKEFPFNVDLGHPAFPAEAANEMYSGIATTTPCNELFQMVFIKAMQDEYDFTPTKYYCFSDNMAFDKEIPGQVHADEADTFCGLIVKERRFGPVSIVTDNPNHRLPFNSKVQRQTQRLQYVMRPFMAVALNSLDRPDTTEKFLDFVIKNKLLNDAEESEGARQDVIKDAILSQNVEVHQKVMDALPKTRQYVEQWFVTQDRDPDYVTDLRVV